MRTFGKILFMFFALNVFVANAQKQGTTVGNNRARSVEPVKRASDTRGFIPAIFPGGESALREYLSKKVHYATEEVNETEGEMRVKFSVEADGSIGNVEMQKSYSHNPISDFNRYAIKVIKDMPRFKPARHKGKSVQSWVTVSFTPTLAFKCDQIRPENKVDEDAEYLTGDSALREDLLRVFHFPPEYSGPVKFNVSFIVYPDGRTGSFHVNPNLSMYVDANLLTDFSYTNAFKPATKDGMRVAVWHNVELTKSR